MAIQKSFTVFYLQILLISWMILKGKVKTIKNSKNQTSNLNIIILYFKETKLLNSFIMG